MTPAAFKSIRTIIGVSQDEMAIHLGVSRHTVLRWESGRVKRIPELAALRAWGWINAMIECGVQPEVLREYIVKDVYEDYEIRLESW